eukprot:TRINITY_DN8928_c0_g2_i3.p1 TRINITY_DN8928_c0_g2~~TRINITY_DN8928_c0_g2_i3.p1  ORF type:complete len:189 (-),score=3.37 TRINITY_DN8928_c0_g2_i3:61-627(-)
MPYQPDLARDHWPEGEHRGSAQRQREAGEPSDDSKHVSCFVMLHLLPLQGGGGLTSSPLRLGCLQLPQAQDRGQEATSNSRAWREKHPLGKQKDGLPCQQKRQSREWEVGGGLGWPHWLARLIPLCERIPTIQAQGWGYRGGYTAPEEGWAWLVLRDVTLVRALRCNVAWRGMEGRGPSSPTLNLGKG